MLINRIHYILSNENLHALDELLVSIQRRYCVVKNPDRTPSVPAFKSGFSLLDPIEEDVLANVGRFVTPIKEGSWSKKMGTGGGNIMPKRKGAKRALRNLLILLEPMGGIEPPTCRLRIDCSTVELHRPSYVSFTAAGWFLYRNVALLSSCRLSARAGGHDGGRNVSRARGGGLISHNSPLCLPP